LVNKAKSLLQDELSAPSRSDTIEDPIRAFVPDSIENVDPFPSSFQDVPAPHGGEVLRGDRLFDIKSFLNTRDGGLSFTIQKIKNAEAQGVPEAPQNKRGDFNLGRGQRPWVSFSHGRSWAGVKIRT
jgi:hypothetical protein